MGAMAMEFDEALTPYVGQISHTPTLEAAREFARGATLYLEEDRHAEARDRFVKASELDPAFLSAHIYAIWARSNLPWDSTSIQWEDSIMAVLVERQSELTPYERAIAEAWRHSWAGHREAYLAGLGEACNLAPGEKACYNLARSLLLSSNDPSGSIEVFQTSDFKPERGWMRGWDWYWRTLLEACHVAGEHALELEVVEEAGEHYPEAAWRLHHKTFALVGLGRVDEVRTLLEDSITSLGPGASSYFHLTVARALDIHGFHEEAIWAWELTVERTEDWIENDPNRPVRYRRLGHTLYSLGRLDESEEHFRRALSLDPDNTLYIWALGMIAAKRGDHVEGRRVVDWLDTLEGESTNTILTRKARIAESMGLREEAVGYLEELWSRRGRPAFNIFERFVPFPNLFGYEPYERLYWPEGRTVY
jgi:tetratricopeptide (TPR) repeat protein